MIENLNNAPQWARKLGQTLDDLANDIKTLAEEPNTEPPEKEEVDSLDEAEVSRVLDAIMPTGLTEDPGKEHRVDPAIKEIVNSIM